MNLKTCLLAAAFIWGLRVPPATAEIFRDHFNRPEMDLRAAPNWAVADGAYYGYLTRQGRAVSVYAPLVGAGAISIDRYAGATHRDERYQRVAIDIRFPQASGDGHQPIFHLMLNWQGSGLFGAGYRLTLRGIKDFAVAKTDAEGAETLSSGWQTYGEDSLKPQMWCRLTLERREAELVGRVATLAGKVIRETKLLDTGEPLDGGHPVLLSHYPSGPLRSIELDNFEYELKNPRKIAALAVGSSVTPQIDGRLEEGCWKQAALNASFGKEELLKSDPEKTLDIPRAQICFDESTLFVGLRCPLTTPEAVQAARELTPPQMFVGNTAEVFLDPLHEYRRRAGLDDDPEEFFFNHLGPKIFRFAVNAANGRFSELKGAPGYRIPWDSATYVGDDFWSAELAIPFASLAYFEQVERGQLEPAWKDHWGLNFVVDDRAWVGLPNADGYPSSVGMLTGLDADPTRYRLAFLTGVGPKLIGEVPVVFTVTNSTGSDRQVMVTASTTGEASDPSPLTFHAPTQLKEVYWIHGQLALPVESVGNHRVLFTVRDRATGAALLHRSLRIDDVQVGAGRWDRSFYLQERTATLLVNLGSAVTGERSLRCELRRHGETQIRQSRTASWKPGETAQIAYYLASLPRGKYVAQVTVSGYEAAPFTAEFQKLLPKKGAVQYDASGTLWRDGKPFFPFGMYGIEHELHGELLEEYGAAGFNTFLLEWGFADGFVQQAQRVQQHGLVPIVGLHNMEDMRIATGGETRYSLENLQQARLPIAREAVRMMLRRAGANYLAWYTRDEPNELMYKVVRGLHEVVHEIDPYHPSMTVIFTPHLFPAYHDATDILGPDIYPTFPNGRLAKVGEAMQKAVREQNGKPVFAVLQSFYPDGHRMPNRAELRCMAYLSVVSGVKGILWFSYNYNGLMAEKHPAAWAALKELAGEFRELSPAFTDSATQPPHVSLQVEAAASIKTRLFSHAGQHFVLAVNEAPVEVGEVKFVLPGVDTAKMDVLFEDRRLTTSKGPTWQDRFGPYEVHIYRLGLP